MTQVSLEIGTKFISKARQAHIGRIIAQADVVDEEGSTRTLYRIHAPGTMTPYMWVTAKEIRRRCYIIVKTQGNARNASEEKSYGLLERIRDWLN